MKSKHFSRLIVTLLVLAQLFAVLPGALADDVSESGLIQVDRFYMAFFYPGTETPIPEDQYGNLPQDATFKIQFEFTVLDTEDEADSIKAGDTYAIPLPAALKNIATLIPASFDMLAYDEDDNLINDTNGVPFVIGTLLLAADGTATITFGNAVEKLNNNHAEFTMSGSLNKSKIGDGTTATFSLTANGVVKDYELGFEDDPKISIQKSGSYNKSTNEIT